MTSPQRRQASGPSSPPKVPAGGVMEGVQQICCQNKNSPFSNWTGSKGRPFGFVWFLLSLWVRRHQPLGIISLAMRHFLRLTSNVREHRLYWISKAQKFEPIVRKKFCWKTLHRTFRSPLSKTNSLHLKMYSWNTSFLLWVAYFQVLVSGAFLVWIQICHTFCSNMTSKM